MLRNGALPEGRTEAAELQKTANGAGHALERVHGSGAFEPVEGATLPGGTSLPGRDGYQREDTRLDKPQLVGVGLLEELVGRSPQLRCRRQKRRGRGGGGGRGRGRRAPDADAALEPRAPRGSASPQGGPGGGPPPDSAAPQAPPPEDRPLSGRQEEDPQVSVPWMREGLHQEFTPQSSPKDAYR